MEGRLKRRKPEEGEGGQCVVCTVRLQDNDYGRKGRAHEGQLQRPGHPFLSFPPRVLTTPPSLPPSLPSLPRPSGTTSWRATPCGTTYSPMVW